MMSRTLTAIAVAVALGATGVSLSLYTDAHPAWWKFVVKPNAPQKPLPAATKDKPIPTATEQAEFDARQEAARLSIIASANEFLTGDSNGRAEWKAPANNGTLCGITPAGRYLITRNRYGVTRYDEPRGATANFLSAWDRVNCQATSPTHQHELLVQQNREEVYKITHPLSADCVMAELHDAGQGYNEKRFNDPHYCRSGQYERDQAAKAQATVPTDEPTAAK